MLNITTGWMEFLRPQVSNHHLKGVGLNQELGFSIAMVFHNESLGIQRSMSCLIKAAGLAIDKGLKVEVLLIDNASSDGSLALAEGLMQGYRIPFRSFVRTMNDMAGARNQALYKAQYEYLLFLDSDCLVPADWLIRYSQWVNDLELQNWTGIGGSNVLQGRGGSSEIFECVDFLRRFPILFLKSAQMGGVKVGYRRVRHLSTCNVLYKKSSLLKVGGFPAWAIRVGEDLALSAVLARRGDVLHQVSGVSVNHLDLLTWESWLKKMFRYGSAQMRVLLRYPFCIQSTKWFPVGLMAILSIVGFYSGLWSLAIIGSCVFVSLALMAVWKKQTEIVIKWPVFLMSSVLVYSLGYLWGLFEEMRGILRWSGN